VSGPTPDEIWQTAIEEGERRLDRGTWALAATGFVGGADIMLGLLAMSATTGFLVDAAGADVAHVAGALAFGLGFVFLVVGRGELFTENFLIPVSAVVAGRTAKRPLLRLWIVTFAANYAGILVFALILCAGGVLQHSTLVAAATPPEVLTARSAGAAFLSAVLAGAVMTLLTWLTHASQYDVARMLLALAIGFLLAIASMNHAVVSFGEIGFGAIAGTAHVDLGDAVRTLALAIAGNLVGGLGLVTLNRLVQARGEPSGG
jgi:formate-nitrite transporter family protein